MALFSPLFLQYYYLIATSFTAAVANICKLNVLYVSLTTCISSGFLGSILVILPGSVFVPSPFQLAREAFMVARNQDPEYVNCVIGQALVAEIGGNPESKNLFRHSTELGLHVSIYFNKNDICVMFHCQIALKLWCLGFIDVIDPLCN